MFFYKIIIISIFTRCQILGHASDYNKRWEIHGIVDNLLMVISFYFEIFLKNFEIFTIFSMQISLQNHLDLAPPLCDSDVEKIEPIVDLYCTSSINSNSSKITFTGPFSVDDDKWTIPIPEICQSNSTIRFVHVFCDIFAVYFAIAMQKILTFGWVIVFRARSRVEIKGRRKIQEPRQRRAFFISVNNPTG